MRPLGLLIIVISFLLPCYWYLELSTKFDKEAIFSQLLGSIALIAMGYSQLLSTRFKVLEYIFGGLDRMYILHKWLGITGVVTLMFHDTIDAELDGLGRETWIMDAAEEGGEIALYGILILAIISMVTMFPYHLWKLTHKFMGAFFVLSAFHYFFIIKPFSLDDPLGLYISIFCIIGIACYIYTLNIGRIFLPTYRYKITNFKTEDEITKIELSPEHKGLKHKAGQFAFLDIAGEKHPFTIASGPNTDRSLQFYAKSLGDYTNKLHSTLKMGMDVRISPAYGRFYFKKKIKTQVWITGGIGITPFIAWLDTINPTDQTDIFLYHCSRGHSLFQKQLEEAAAQHTNLRLYLIDSHKSPRLTINQISSDLEEKFKGAHFYFCGPKTMRENLQKDLTLLHPKKAKIHYEEFEIRTGINFMPLMKFLLNLGKR